ncbi:uncharacterized protein STEHIDRAFT_170160 [Stereum hirsutum FP-91666 SS1]|uniref:uncharacterized protein n=1 Tax=Stereum hirsutum (strain FP-91666) TaxID=721885 RepID=UPI00044498F7|nr:uncharacterized protein STEHIDRAFT_170160 [Stereum hirsutum FP-91666 SS1]EIM84474.1 hypothetical protein STEHIDRAFT_170160 [Stereum hirsutum FP-91666 SS1]
MSSSASYLQALLSTSSVPPEYQQTIESLISSPNSPETQAIEALLRLVSNGPCPPSANLQTQSTWSSFQTRVTETLASLIPETSTGTNGTRRKRSPSPEGPSTPPKKLKPSPSSSSALLATNPNLKPTTEAQDLPLFTLPALSLTSPLRKKLTITIHQASLRLTNPTTNALEYPPIPLSQLKRCFLLPTRGKAKLHWTVILMSGDVPDKAKGGAKGKANDKEKDTAKEKEVANVQVTFGIDAEPTTAFATTTYPTSESKSESENVPSTTTHPKGTPSRPSLLTFLSHLPEACSLHTPVPPSIPSASLASSTNPKTDPDDSSAATSTGPIARGITAYRGAKESTIWFFKQGLLLESKPCEFWALHDLAPPSEESEAGVAGYEEGVRMLSATGRTCSVFLKRRAERVGGGDGKEKAGGADGKGNGAGEEEEEEEMMEGEETELGMVDGKEQEGIREWVRKYRSSFGRVPSSSSSSASKPHQATSSPSKSNANGKDSKGKGKAQETDKMEVDGEGDGEADSDSDSNFEVDSSDDDGGSPSSGSDSDSEGDSDGGSNASDAETGDEGEDGEDDEGGGSQEEEDEEEEEALDPKHHPLLRPGAMPKKMSKATMDAAVGMVLGDMMGGGSKKDTKGSKKVVEVVEMDEGEDGEDELED